MIGIFRESPAPSGTQLHADTALTKRSVREQVERILASPLFRNSKRYTGLLKYVVEQKLEGRTELLKERLLGIEVFGREPDYDTNHDPVVRTSAVEIRKRLAQYYDEPAHRTEIRILLPAGSYAPEFSAAELPGSSLQIPEAIPQKRSWLVPATLAALGVAVLTALGLCLSWNSRSALDEFWRPVREASAPVLFGVSGGPRQNRAAAAAEGPKTLSDLFRAREDYVPFGDVSALVDLAGYMRAKGKAYRLQYASTVTFPDLKSGPAVLIGPTMRWFEQLAVGTRFSVLRDEGVTRTWISDRQNPAKQLWSADVNAPAASTADTYALITRIRLESTRQVLVSIAGLSPYATSAAGELLADPQYLNEFGRSRMRDWGDHNLQLVLATKRVGTTPGSPRIIAYYSW